MTGKKQPEADLPTERFFTVVYKLTDANTAKYLSNRDWVTYVYADSMAELRRQHAELEALRASHGQALRLLTQKEKDSLGRRAEGMDGNEWDTWVQGKFAQVNGLIVQGGSYE